MLYPIYDYYYESSMNLDDILTHYVENFYLRKHGRDKYEKILKKLSESSKVRSLFDESYQKRLALNNVDFGATVNSIMWFMIQSNETQAVAVLAMALFWNTNVNSHLHLKSERELRDDALKIFKKFQIYGDMTQEEFDSMRYHQDEDEYDEYPELDEDVDDEDDEEQLDDEVDSDEGKGYHILNFYLDCSYWHRQEDEINKCPIIIPVKIVDVDEEDDIVSKYEVRNLPTLILVDGKGKEIHRWVGVTPTSEINNYISSYGYDEEVYEDEDENDEDNGDDETEESMDMSKLPAAFRDRMNDPDFQDKMLAIMAEGGTKEQIKLKLDYMLGEKRKSTEIALQEDMLRKFLRKRFDELGKKILENSNSYDIMHKIRATSIITKFNNDLEDPNVFPEINDIKREVNKIGISWNIIKAEEYKRALAIYRDGKVVD